MAPLDIQRLVIDNDDEIERQESSSSPTSNGNCQDILLDRSDNDCSSHRTLSSISTPDNMIWNLSTTSGRIRFKLHLVMDHITARERTSGISSCLIGYCIIFCS